jgi:hypothetical protein
MPNQDLQGTGGQWKFDVQWYRRRSGVVFPPAAECWSLI